MAATERKGTLLTSSGIHFIVSTDVKKADPETRKLIRSHVMLGKNRLKARRSKPREKVSSEVTVDFPSQDSRVPLDRVLDACHSVVPRRVGSDLSFANFAIEIKPAKWRNVIRFFTASLGIMYPLAAVIDFHRKDKSWFELYTVDAVYLHVTVFAVQALANSLSCQVKYATKQEAGFHFLKGVQLLQQRLSTGDEEAKASDSTLSAVLTLATTAHVIGDFKTANMHIEGLRKMVNLRGGLAALRDQKLLMELFRCDIGMTLRSGSKSMFFNDALLEPFVPYPDEILWSSRKTGAENNSQSFFDEVPEDLYMTWTVMQMPYSHISAQFRDCLLQLELTNEPPSQLMFWLLIVGIISIFTSPEDVWLKKALRKHMEICQIKSWDEMRGILKSFMWIDLLHDKPGKDIFESVLML
ncbi:uncharacterized protein PAC_15704 [Phialocephala subalpina]|uniref:Uncharacterized protein n=1 Tax=Phialocephala subalpina TaxID=576137 RepID=A0A1L7XLB8_9HELO|nr:uncharacterized protein PAC_15704 [Phialocephala subalpina]